MKKNFDEWSGQKKLIHKDKKRPYFHTREIWFCSLGSNIGFEQDGRGDDFLRPVIVLKKFNNEICWIIPITKNQKSGKYYFNFSFTGNEHDSSSAILSQIRLLDAKRLAYKIGDISETDYLEMKKLVIKLFD